MKLSRSLTCYALTATFLAVLSTSAMAGWPRRREVVVVAPAPVVVAAAPVVQTAYIVEAAPTYVVRQRPVFAEAPVVVSAAPEVVRLAPATQVVQLAPVERVYTPTTVVVPTTAVLPAPRYVVQPARGRVVIPRQVLRLGY